MSPRRSARPDRPTTRHWLARLPFIGGASAQAAHLNLGRRGERDAARFLRTQGCRTVVRNLRTPGGEADLVCLDRYTASVVLVEVKARVRDETDETGPRSKSQAISPAAAINADKRRRLVRTATSLQQHPRFAGRPIRIDVVTVEYTHANDRSPTIRHYANAVTASGQLR